MRNPTQPMAGLDAEVAANLRSALETPSAPDRLDQMMQELVAINTRLERLEHYLAVLEQYGIETVRMQGHRLDRLETLRDVHRCTVGGLPESVIVKSFGLDGLADRLEAADPGKPKE